MSDYVEDALLSLLNQARSNAEIAAHNERLAEAEHSKRTRDVSHLEGLLAHHLRQVAAEPPTQAIPAVSAMAEPEPPFVSWDALVGGRVVVTLTNGNVYDGVLESLGGGKAVVRGREGEGIAGSAFLPLDEVESIRPVVAPVPQGVAEATPEITRPDETPDGAQ